MNSAIFSTILLVLFVLAAQASSYKILVIPLPLKSHIFSLFTIAEGLADRKHNVSFFVGENFGLNEAAMKRRPEINFVKYDDSLDGVAMDYNGTFENVSRMVMDTQADMITLAPLIRKQ